jgi:hypothetical protein
MKKIIILALLLLFAPNMAALAEAAAAPRLQKIVITQIGNDADGNMYVPLTDGDKNFIYGDSILLEIKYVGHPSGTASFFYQYGNLIGRISRFEKSGAISADGETVVQYAIPFASLPSKNSEMIGQIVIVARGSNGGSAETAVYNIWKSSLRNTREEEDFL